MKNVYSVIAYRYGDKERHSYIVGVYSTSSKAQRAADREEDYRGVKYSCEILEIGVDVGTEGVLNAPFNMIRSLPKVKRR